ANRTSAACSRSACRERFRARNWHAPVRVSGDPNDEPLAPRPPPHTPSAKRVLVVEDDEDLRFIVVAELEGHGHLVEQAENGLQPLDAVEHAWPDLILLDMRMPVMDGWRFVSELRKRYGRVVPIVVMSAAADARARAREVGAEACLAKPFELTALIDAV